jgi:hypothetical protein
MSTSARLQAADSWKTRYKDIKQAQSRRTIPREELAEMPKATITTAEAYERNPNGVSAMVILSEEMPDLVESDSEGENCDDNWETNSTTSSVDSACGFFQQRFDKDRQGTYGIEESGDCIGDSENYTCLTCAKPRWNSSNLPAKHHCRDFCLHQSSADSDTASTTASDDAPDMPMTMDKPSHAMALMPE